MRAGPAVIILACSLCACAADGSQPSPPVPTAAAPLPPTQSGFEMTPAGEAQTPGDTCGADRLQWLVGRPRTQIPVAVDLSLRRVTCTACPVTMDFNPRRLNIFFDEASGIVKEVKCG